MAVRAEHDVAGIGHARPDAGEEVADLVRRGVADRVRQVHRGRAGVDDRLDHPAQEVEVAARGVLGRELHVGRVAPGEAHRFDRRLQALLARHPQLGLQVQIRGGDERVDAALLGRLQRPGGAFEVGLVAAREAGDHRPPDLGRDGAHGLGVGRRGNRKARLDDVHAKGIELPREGQLLGRPQREPGRLLAVPERGIEDTNLILSHRMPPADRGARAWLIASRRHRPR